MYVYAAGLSSPLLRVPRGPVAMARSEEASSTLPLPARSPPPQQQQQQPRAGLFRINFGQLAPPPEAVQPSPAALPSASAAAAAPVVRLPSKPAASAAPMPLQDTFISLDTIFSPIRVAPRPGSLPALPTLPGSPVVVGATPHAGVGRDSAVPDAPALLSTAAPAPSPAAAAPAADLGTTAALVFATSPRSAAPVDAASVSATSEILAAKSTVVLAPILAAPIVAAGQTPEQLGDSIPVPAVAPSREIMPSRMGRSASMTDLTTQGGSPSFGPDGSRRRTTAAARRLQPVAGGHRAVPSLSDSVISEGSTSADASHVVPWDPASDAAATKPPLEGAGMLGGAASSEGASKTALHRSASMAAPSTVLASQQLAAENAAIGVAKETTAAGGPAKLKRKHSRGRRVSGPASHPAAPSSAALTVGASESPDLLRRASSGLLRRASFADVADKLRGKLPESRRTVPAPALDASIASELLLQVRARWMESDCCK
jgi:hypothetical protein